MAQRCPVESSNRSQDFRMRTRSDNSNMLTVWRQNAEHGNDRRSFVRNTKHWKKLKVSSDDRNRWNKKFYKKDLQKLFWGEHECLCGISWQFISHFAPGENPNQSLSFIFVEWCISQSGCEIAGCSTGKEREDPPPRLHVWMSEQNIVIIHPAGVDSFQTRPKWWMDGPTNW